MTQTAVRTRTPSDRSTRREEPIRPLYAAWMLAWREIIRFVRQRNRLVGAIGQPVLFWLLFGAGMNQTFRVPGQRFSEYFVPGTLAMILLSTAIFATISIIEDRQEGFLQSVLVSPLPRWALVLGKLSGGTILAVAQSCLFLGLAVAVGQTAVSLSFLAALILMILIGLGLTGLGFCLAWRLDSTQGFHAIMSLLLMPMWLLSGAFFPVPQWIDSSTWGERILHAIMRANPLTYSVAGLRQTLAPTTLSLTDDSVPHLWQPSIVWCWVVTGTFAALMFWAATRTARQATSGDFQ